MNEAAVQREDDNAGQAGAATRDYGDHDHGDHDHGDHAGHDRRGAEEPDPLVLLRALEASDRFRRDTALGGMFHYGKISYREVSPTESLHVIIDGNRVSAHVDTHSPLRIAEDGSASYAWSRVLLHNVSVVAGDFGRLLLRRRGEHRCNLTCEVEWVDDLLGEGPPDPGPDPHRADPAVPDGVPFGLIDEAIHLLDSDAAPWSIQLEVEVAGRVDEQLLRASLGQAMTRHPMARARKAPSRGWLRLDHWQLPAHPDRDPLRVVECVDDDAVGAARAELQNTAVPLTESPPLRAHLVRGPSSDTVVLNVNHAAMDCYGGLRVLQSVARAYSGQADPRPELGFVEARELPVRLASSDSAARPRASVAAASRLRDLAVPTAELAPDGPAGTAGYGFHRVVLDRAHTAAVFALRPAGSETAVLLAALHLAIDGWNAEHGRRCRRIGVTIPANLRPRQWRDEMVGNFCLPGRSTTTQADRRSPRVALEALTAQSGRPHQPGVGTAIVGTLGESALFPLWIKKAVVRLLPMTGNRLVDTASFCYLGELADGLAFGSDGEAAAALWFSPPARTPIGLTVGAVTVGGCLHLVFRYRRRMFGADAGRRFAERTLAALDQLVEDCDQVDSRRS